MKPWLLMALLASLCIASPRPIPLPGQTAVTPRTDTARVNSLIAQARLYWYTNSDSMLMLGKEAMDLAKQLDFQPGIAQSLYVMGRAYYMQSDYLESNRYCSQSLELATKLGQKELISDGLNMIGTNHYGQGNYSKALEYYLAALTEREVLGDSLKLAASYDNIGLVYAQLENTQKALSYHFKALAIAKKLQSKRDIAITLTNIAITYQIQQEYDKALSMYWQVNQTFKEINDQLGLRITLRTIAQIYLEQKEYNKALVYASQALHIANKTKDNQGVCLATLTIADIYRHSGKHLTSIEFATKTLKLAQKTGMQVVIQDTYETLSANYKAQKNYAKAFYYQERARTIRDSIFNLQKANLISSLQFDYELKKKELQIQTMHQDQIRQKQQLTSQTLQRYALFVGLVYWLGWFLWYAGSSKQDRKSEG
jgi:tetratricopeptide (TPR) repeat protein